MRSLLNWVTEIWFKGFRQNRPSCGLFLLKLFKIKRRLFSIIVDTMLIFQSAEWRGEVPVGRFLWVKEVKFTAIACLHC